MPRTPCLLALAVALVAQQAGAEPRRFQALTSQGVYVAPSDFHEETGAATAGVSGVMSHAFSSTLLQVPQLVGDDDVFIWAFQHAYDRYSFSGLSSNGTSSFARGPALGEPPKPPFEALQVLRGMWTWRHGFEGYNFYLHNRTGIHSDVVEFDTRRFRMGVAAALERQWSEDHTLGAGMVVLWGIGGVQPIPFLRYLYDSPALHVFALLPLWARFYLPLGGGAQVGVVLEADGNRYRVEHAGQAFDNVDLVYSYWGPSFRVSPLEDFFLRADVGLSGYRVLDLYFDERLTSAFELDRTTVVSLALSWEPAY